MAKKKPDDQAPPDGEQSEFDMGEAVTQALDTMPDNNDDAPIPASPVEPEEGAPTDGEPPADGEQEPAPGDGGAGEGEGDEPAPDGGKKPGDGEEGTPDDQAAKAKREADDDLLSPPAEETAEWSDRTKKRFESLSTRVRDQGQQLERVSQERDQVAQDYQTITEIIRKTNAPPEQLAELFDITGELMSGDVQKGAKGVQRAYDMIKGWANHYGVKLPEHSILSDFPDLQQMVESGQVTQEIAEQHAELRRRQAAQTHHQQRQQQQGDQARQYMATAQQASTDIQSLENHWKTNDPDYAHKAPLLTQYAEQLAQQVMAGQVHPSQLPRLVKERYDTITQTMGAMSKLRPPANGNEPNPMRPGGSRAGSSQPLYKTFEDSVVGALKSM